PKLTTLVGGGFFLWGVVLYLTTRQDGLQPEALALLANPLFLGGIIWWAWKTHSREVFVITGAGEEVRVLSNASRQYALMVKDAVAKGLSSWRQAVFAANQFFTLTDRCLFTRSGVYSLRWFTGARLPQIRDRSKVVRRLYIVLSAISLHPMGLLHGLSWES